ncbi:MAG: SgcJ/EcaC family oxidoreductase, partial [Woeseia sp.]
MKKYRVIAASLSALVATACAPQADVETEKNAVRELDRQWESATAASGAEGWISFVTEDAVIYPPDGPVVRGREAVGEYMEHLLPPDLSVRWQPDYVEVSGTGDLATMFGTYEITASGAAGDSPVSRGKYGNAWTKKADGGWKVVASVWNSTDSDAGEGDQQSLYRRLGGYDVVAAILDNTGPRVIGDPDLSDFFAEMDEQAGIRGRELGVDLLCELTGGPCFYIGPELRSVHEGLGITDGHWRSFMGHLSATLDEMNIGGDEKTDVIAVFAGL